MATENEVSETPITPYSEGARALVEQLRAMRQLIPHFVIPTAKGGRQKLVSITSLPVEFVELTAVARTHSPALVRGDKGTTPAETRDLLAYADAYGPVADELEALAQFVRFSIAAAKGKAGQEALTTYALACRLARLPEYADLAPHVADMRRALGNRGKRPTAAALARKKQQQAATATPPSAAK